MVNVLTIYKVIDSACGMKTSNSIWRPFPLSEDVSEEELKTDIQKAVLEKTKIARKYSLKNSKGKKKKNLKYQFDCLTRRIVAGGSSALV